MNEATVTILALTTLWTLVVAVIGGAILWRFRRRSLRVTIIVAALAPMAAALAAVLQSVRAMFISEHDSWVVLWTLAFAALLGLGMAVLLGHWVSVSSRDVGLRLRRLGTTYEPSAAATGVVPAELAALTDELETTRQKLAASHARERALEASRRELVAFMSHDLRTPLAGLRAVAEGLEDDVITDVPGALRQMRTTVDRMTGLVDDLFELSRLSAAELPRKRSAVSLRELAEDVVGENTEHARASGVELSVSTPSGDDRLAVQGDPDELTRAVTNLVGNAIRHTTPGGAVTLLVDREPDGRVRLAVTDGCGGIPADDLSRVFDIGWRGDEQRTPAAPTATATSSGGGLGLAIARGVVESHAGHIGVTNTPGGCTFQINLPPIPTPTP
ncbi:HAMP domain-containing histidine kinase [Kribbella sandramycini]|uniref:histidine kinase n=1 Tax=Kribbella sandramycini TaxID=60450 RepID=A0A7Y4P587_9ACTN|nr:HAMP domain-containing sensor histidine kinase [Kribbella sandramycini]MBB6570212.1 signal transduction histidine kinase [Kribbella sandramycini]NOL45935.1 HAMP domain-containing histidine kinase [Kribbella sandramycini]